MLPVAVQTLLFYTESLSMFGLMQNQPLLQSSLIEFAAANHGDTEIVSRRVEGDVHRYTWHHAARRVRQLAHALDGLGLSADARVGTVAWNGYRHLELYYGVSGNGRIIHTINPRLHPDQMAWIINHAEDEVVCFDMTFLPLMERIHAQCPGVRHWIALCDADALPPDSGIPHLSSYEALIAHQPTTYDWPSLDEHTASGLCYTSGTTGNPKGALYSHRSNILHALSAIAPDAMCLSARDVVLPVVPMFHVNAWGIPFSAAMTGCKLVFPGPALDGPSVYELMEREQVTFSAGVPTVWQMLLMHVQGIQAGFSSLRRTVIGGAACPPAMIDAFERMGVQVIHAWGMTELSPLGALSTLKQKHQSLSHDDQRRLLVKQGRPVFGVELAIMNDDGRALPHDGVTYGNLMARGNWVIERYFRSDAPAVSEQGWFHTGDVATIDPDSFMQITDRSKDVIKSGGEWISSIDIENIAMGHPAVAMAACIGMPHPKWDERPIVVVSLKPGTELARDELLAFYQGKLAKWQIPDDVVFVDTIPLGATGKMLKTRVRQMLEGYMLPAL